MDFRSMSATYIHGRRGMVIANYGGRFPSMVVLRYLRSLGAFAAAVLTLRYIRERSLSVSGFYRYGCSVLTQGRVFRKSIGFVGSGLDSSIVAMFLDGCGGLFFSRAGGGFFVDGGYFVLFGLLRGLYVFDFGLLAFRAYRYARARICSYLYLSVARSGTFSRFYFYFLGVLEAASSTSSFIGIVRDGRWSFRSVDSLLYFVRIVLYSSYRGVFLVARVMLRRLGGVRGLQLVVGRHRRSRAGYVLGLYVFVWLVRGCVQVRVAAGLGASSRAFAIELIAWVDSSVGLFVSCGLDSLFSRAYFVCRVQGLDGGGSILSILR